MNKTDKYKTVRVSDETYNIVHALATVHDMPMSKVINIAVKKQAEPPKEMPKGLSNDEQFEWIAEQLLGMTESKMHPKK